MKEKGLRVNIDKTKVMVCSANNNLTTAQGKYPCGVCKKGVDANSILCTCCQKWIHKKCSGITGRLREIPLFKCSFYLTPSLQKDISPNIRLGGTEYDSVKQFCYLGDMISAGGGVEARQLSASGVAGKNSDNSYHC